MGLTGAVKQAQRAKAQICYVNGDQDINKQGKYICNCMHRTQCCLAKLQKLLREKKIGCLLVQLVGKREQKLLRCFI